MTRKQARIAGAWAAGEVVQFRSTIDPNAHWFDFIHNELSFDGHIEWRTLEWRIKPKAREWWICPKCHYQHLHNEGEVILSHSAFGSGLCSEVLIHVREVLE